MSISKVIGRFQGLHNGQLNLIRSALNSVSDKVIIILGSAFKPRDFKNPFTFEERKNVIISSFGITQNNDKLFYNGKEVFIVGQRDVCFCEEDDVIWASEVNAKVNAIKSYADEPVHLYGFEKDSSSYYLKIFNNCIYHETNSGFDLNSTDIRVALYEDNLDSIVNLVPKESFVFLQNFRSSENYLYVLENYLFHKGHYAKIEKQGREYEEIFHCADALIVNEFGEVLLIQRVGINDPGRDTFAMPGGYMNAKERNSYTAAKRECKEETGLSNIEGVYHHQQNGIGRSLRGRIISDVYKFKVIKSECKLKAGDDAKAVFWVNPEFVRMNPHLFFEYHDQAILRAIG